MATVLTVAPSRNGAASGLVPERQRQIDVVVLPAGRDLQCIRVAVQFAFGEFDEHFVETARPDPRCPDGVGQRRIAAYELVERHFIVRRQKELRVAHERMIEQHAAQILRVHRAHGQDAMRGLEVGSPMRFSAAQQIGDVELEPQPQLGHRVAAGFQDRDAGIVHVVIGPALTGPPADHLHPALAQGGVVHADPCRGRAGDGDRFDHGARSASRDHWSGTRCGRRCGKRLLQVLDPGGKLFHGVDQHVRQRRGVEDAHVVEPGIVRDAGTLDRLGKNRLDFLAEHAHASLPRQRARTAVVPKAYRTYLSQLGEPQLEIAHVLLDACIGSRRPRSGAVGLEGTSRDLKNRRPGTWEVAFSSRRSHCRCWKSPSGSAYRPYESR